MGPLAFFIFGPIFDLAGFLADWVLNKVSDALLEKVSVTFTQHGAWLIDCLRIQECLSAYVSALCLGFVISVVKGILL